MITSTTIDFRELTDSEIAQFVVDHLAEFGDYVVSVESILAADIAIERTHFGFAIVQDPRGYRHDEHGNITGGQPHLWFLYVSPEHRGRGHGRRIVRDVLSKYGRNWLMSVYCDVSRRAYYSQFGFRVIERDGRLRKMEMRGD